LSELAIGYDSGLLGEGTFKAVYRAKWTDRSGRDPTAPNDRPRQRDVAVALWKAAALPNFAEI
jgi:hypothetical protein